MACTKVEKNGSGLSRGVSSSLFQLMMVEADFVEACCLSFS